MAKFEVTPELCETIRILRQAKGVKSIDIAKAINKSPAYISRLEKNQIKTISIDDLFHIFKEINIDSNSDEVIERLIDSLTLKLTKDEIEEELWFMNFDTVIRLIPVPSDFVDYVNKTLSESNNTIQELANIINANLEVPEEVKQNPAFEKNIWCNTGEKGLSIIFRLNIKFFERLLSKRIKKTSYAFLQAIAFGLIRLQKNMLDRIEDDSVYSSLIKESRNLLLKYGIYRIMDRGDLIEIKDNSAYSLSQDDAEVQSQIIDINEALQYVANRDVASAKIWFDSFINNLHWDIGFVFSLLNLQFCKLDKLSLSQRKDLLNQISELIEDFSEYNSEEPNISNYLL